MPLSVCHTHFRNRFINWLINILLMVLLKNFSMIIKELTIQVINSGSHSKGIVFAVVCFDERSLERIARYFLLLNMLQGLPYVVELCLFMDYDGSCL